MPITSRSVVGCDSCLIPFLCGAWPWCSPRSTSVCPFDAICKT